MNERKSLETITLHICASVDIPIYVGWKAILTYMCGFKNKVISNFLFLFSWTGKILFSLGFNQNILKDVVPSFT